MLSFRVLGLLLAYPTDDLVSDLPDMRRALADDALIAPDLLGPLFDHLAGTDLLDLQENHVSLFDRTLSLSLHLYEHVWGDARERGQAMVRLQTVYQLHGLEHSKAELPDFLPLFCEFLSLVPLPAARSMLSDAAPILELLRVRLDKRSAPHAAVFAALSALASRSPDPEILRQMAKGGLTVDDSLDALDRLWEETAVTFGPGSDGCGVNPLMAATPAGSRQER